MTLLGEAQEAWLHRNLDRSTARWNILAQQTLMAEFDRTPGSGRAFWTDGWDGYPAARTRLLEFIAERAPRNPLVIGGDVHAFWVSDLKTDFRHEHAKTIASEIVGSSITSVSSLTDERRAAIQEDSPHLQYGNSVRRGYVHVGITEERAQADLHGVSDVTDPASGIETLASFVIEDGRPGPRKI